MNRESTDNRSEAWLQTSRHGDPDAFGKLVEKYQREVYGLILRLTHNEALADDLTQETFLSAWQKLSGFREISSLRSWLLTIALNKVRSYWRWKKLRNWLSLGSVQNEQGQTLEETIPDLSRKADPASVFEDANFEDHFQTSLSKLPVRQREVIGLRAQGLNIDEIACVLKMAEGTVKAHIFHAKEKLQEKMEIKA